MSEIQAVEPCHQASSAVPGSKLTRMLHMLHKQGLGCVPHMKPIPATQGSMLYDLAALQALHATWIREQLEQVPCAVDLAYGAG